MHDCGWVEGATCQQDHSLTSHPNPSLSVISQCYSNAPDIFVNLLYPEIFPELSEIPCLFEVMFTRKLHE